MAHLILASSQDLANLLVHRILSEAECTAEAAADTAQASDGNTLYFWVGVILSVVADAAIAISLNVQKLAHNRNRGPDGEPLKFYMRLPLWWVGMILNIGGEAGNGLAYGFAPASVVAPVGSVGVIFNEVIAVSCLKEPLRKRDIAGLVAVVAGVVLIIVSVPEDGETLTARKLLSDEYFGSPRAYGYLAGLVSLVAFILVFLERRFARDHILVWLSLCSIISSVTVIASRGFFSLLIAIPSDCSGGNCYEGSLDAPCSQTLGQWIFWLLGLTIGVTCVWSTHYLQRAMMVFGNTEVVPVYYCTFTLLSIVGGAVVYNEFAHVSAVGFVLFACGIILAGGGVCLVTSDRKAAAEYQDQTIEAKLDTMQKMLTPRVSELRRPEVEFGAGGSLAQFLANDRVLGNRDAACRMAVAAHTRPHSADQRRQQSQRARATRRMSEPPRVLPPPFRELDACTEEASSSGLPSSPSTPVNPSSPCSLQKDLAASTAKLELIALRNENSISTRTSAANAQVATRAAQVAPRPRDGPGSAPKSRLSAGHSTSQRHGVFRLISALSATASRIAESLGLAERSAQVAPETGTEPVCEEDSSQTGCRVAGLKVSEHSSPSESARVVAWSSRARCCNGHPPATTPRS